jgi:uncharacterized protein with NRDE domain
VCLIVVAHLASSRLPLVIAANRDEDYERATHDAHTWSDAPEVVGGKDALHGGSWLAVRRGGRFAAVTNLAGAPRRARSRGFLVRDFVTGDLDASEYGAGVVGQAEEYAGFHLLAGDAGGDILYITPATATPLAAGVHALTNAPEGMEWPKSSTAVEHMRGALAITNVEALVDDLMRFLSTPRGTGSIEGEVFIAGDRYGTRSSAVVVATQTEILFVEQSYARGGVPAGERRVFCLVR